MRIKGSHINENKSQGSQWRSLEVLDVSRGG